MRTGWLQSTYNNANKIFYMSPDGNMLTGYQVINGLTYYFNLDDGSLAINTVTPDGRTVGSDGIVK